MNRKEFMQKLEYLLRNISAEERQEALQYYEDYFDDAGAEEEQKVIRELMSPEHVANTILDGLRGGSVQGEFTENGYEDGKYRNYQSMAPQRNTRQSQQDSKQFGQPGNHLNKTLIIILLILTFPFYGGIVLGALGALFGIFVAVIAVTASMLFGGVALIGAGIALFITLQVAKGCVLCGVGLLLLAIGIPCLIFTIWLCGKAIPELCKAAYLGLKRIFGNGGVVA